MRKQKDFPVPFLGVGVTPTDLYHLGFCVKHRCKRVLAQKHHLVTKGEKLEGKLRASYNSPRGEKENYRHLINYQEVSTSHDIV